MVHDVLSLARAGQGLDVGAELRLDAMGAGLQEPGGPELSATVSRAALMLTGHPSDKGRGVRMSPGAHPRAWF